jgi:hypothetical protein
MPRPILGTPQGALATVTPAQPTTTARSSLSPAQTSQRLRQTRSRAYLAAMAGLDAGAHHADRAGRAALIEAISNEFPELGIEERPLGIVSKCFLGPPYEVHICDLAGDIIQHFETFRPMPPLYERARALAGHDAYAFIEIYADTLRAVMQDGTVAVIEA